MATLPEEMIRLERSGISYSILTVVKASGSTPRDAGAKMLVTREEAIGTIGGAVVEKDAVEAGRAALGTGVPELLEFELREDKTGMACGGAMTVFVEPVLSRPALYIFGAGHVGTALADLAHKLEFRVILLDSRPEWADADRFPDGVETRIGPYRDLAPGLESSADDYIVIMTHSHDIDQEVLGAVLEKRYRYLGLICSKRKKSVLFGNLEEAGKPKELLDEVYSPIGLKISSETPVEIAVSIAAELVKVRRGGGK